MSEDDTTPLFVSPAAAGRILGISRSTVYRLLATKILHGRKVCGLLLIDVSAARAAFNALPPAEIRLKYDEAHQRLPGSKTPKVYGTGGASKRRAAKQAGTADVR